MIMSLCMITDRYRSLPNFTVTCVTSITRVTSVTDRNKGPFEIKGLFGP